MGVVGCVLGLTRVQCKGRPIMGAVVKKCCTLYMAHVLGAVVK